MKDKQEIILEYIRNGKSQRQISRETGISRETIRKYINEYEKNLVELGSIKEGDELIKVDLIDEIVKTPKYKTGKRQKRVLTDEVIDRIKFYLKENENKRLNGLSKQQKRKRIYMKL
ncbi:helix-turn-helix domain-containing protein [Caloramator sp. mosi_1]|nr:helix-turn-helix domain-containing protein [Caloramator sp. mosi_1]WDC83387.1 helix-turn-helix domain-containing protein [Caloramator sp. mosi_1]WDC83590.1 helix-turn-helix domain-containing protein [Caloramator sp. mosi_1]WDC84521.1 helix-turn-helix domain-containing protein [Caloramator sp. mosi_1]